MAYEKKAQFNFGWMFAIIVGGAILALAVYGVMQIGDTQRLVSDSEVGKKLSIITEPLQAGFSEGSFGKITFRAETRINNFCLAGGGFGSNDISVSTRSQVGEDWLPAGASTSVGNKYIFSSQQTGGKEFYVFSKPFDFPYKVADLIFLTSGDYCFINAPDKIADEVLGLNIKNINIGNCSIEGGDEGNSIMNVCFGSGVGCDITVRGSCVGDCGDYGSYEYGIVERFGGGSQVSYMGSLMYGAIFSDKGVYDCNVERLMYRAGKIADAYAKKAEFMNGRGCSTNMGGEMIMWGGLVANSSANDLVGLRVTAKRIGDKNELETSCGGVW
jgi:hypothetical protein